MLVSVACHEAGCALESFLGWFCIKNQHIFQDQYDLSLFWTKYSALKPKLLTILKQRHRYKKLKITAIHSSSLQELSSLEVGVTLTRAGIQTSPCRFHVLRYKHGFAMRWMCKQTKGLLPSRLVRFWLMGNMSAASVRPKGGAEGAPSALGVQLLSYSRSIMQCFQ